MQQDGLSSQLGAFHRTPKDVKGECFHFLSDYWVLYKHVKMDFTPIISLNLHRTFEVGNIILHFTGEKIEEQKE